MKKSLPSQVKRRKGKAKKRKKPHLKKHTIRFEETAVGHYLYVYAPIEFCLLMEWNKSAPKERFRRQAIRYEQIEAMALHSDNPVFKSAGFRRALISYRRFGLHPTRGNRWTVQDAVHYAKYSYLSHKMIKRCTEN